MYKVPSMLEKSFVLPNAILPATQSSNDIQQIGSNFAMYAKHPKNNKYDFIY